jgi:hypothetical protein
MSTIEDHLKKSEKDIDEQYKNIEELYKFLIKKSRKWEIEDNF